MYTIKRIANDLLGDCDCCFTIYLFSISTTTVDLQNVYVCDIVSKLVCSMAFCVCISVASSKHQLHLFLVKL